jgi:hypothetical protein
MGAFVKDWVRGSRVASRESPDGTLIIREDTPTR